MGFNSGFKGLKKYPHLMQPEISVPCLRDPFTVLYSMPKFESLSNMRISYLYDMTQPKWVIVPLFLECQHNVRIIKGRNVVEE